MKASRSAVMAAAASLFVLPAGARQSAPSRAIPVGQVSGVTLLPVTVPYTLDSGLMVVHATVGDGDDQLAAVDTSLPVCLVAPALAATQRILSEDTTDVQTLYGAIRVPMARTQTIKVGSLVMTGVGVGIESPLSALSSRKPAQGPSVWIGSSALSALVLTIDPVAKTMTFSGLRTPLPKGALVAPFTVQDGRVVVEARANGGSPFRAVVSTGCSGTLIPARVVASLKLKDGATIAIQHPNGRQGKASIVELDELSIGPLRIAGVPAVYLHPDQAASPDELGVIGTDVLAEYRVTIHYGLRKIAFEPLFQPAPPEKLTKPNGPNGQGRLPGGSRRGYPTMP